MVQAKFPKRDSDFGNVQFVNQISGIHGHPFSLLLFYINFHVPIKGKRANNFISMQSLLTSDSQSVEQ